MNLVTSEVAENTGKAGGHSFIQTKVLVLSRRYHLASREQSSLVYIKGKAVSSIGKQHTRRA